MRSSWTLEAPYAHLKEYFGSLEAVFALQGERLTKDRISEVIRIEREGIRYYIKRYWDSGKGMRRFWGTPRIKAEWQNLRCFVRWGVPTASIVAYGLQREKDSFRGVLITQELENTQDLALLAKLHDPRLKDPQWVDRISRQLANATRILHQHRFTHNDLKWRNLLVNPQGELFFIDCPSGRFWWGPFLRQRVIKDFACLDKVAKYQLSRTQRLRFYLHYQQRAHLLPKDKPFLRQIVQYFEGRE